LRDLATTNADNADLAKIIANVEAGKDPLSGLSGNEKKVIEETKK
jgi:hypothetical protein